VAIALIVAAGRGERLGFQAPKALVPLAGRSLLQWSVDTLLEVDEIERIAVALPPGVDAPAGTVGAPGGEVRSRSVALALAAAGAGDPVLVHDAARPLLTGALVRDTIAALRADQSLDGAIAATHVTDTVKRASEGVVRETLERSSLWAVQTPQVFRRGALERALDVSPELLAAATDDAWLIERLGGSVAIVPSSPENLKITTPLDLRLAELLLTSGPEPSPPEPSPPEPSQPA
jgi:2-C-methyl-D-erythritol 4-phosphate cytidylyltransferase